MSKAKEEPKMEKHVGKTEAPEPKGVVIEAREAAELVELSQLVVRAEKFNAVDYKGAFYAMLKLLSGAFEATGKEE